MKRWDRLMDESGATMSLRQCAAPRGAMSLKLLGAMSLATLALHLFPEAAWAQEISGRTYGDFPLVGGRVAVWVAAQVHLLFAAFVLGVPMFAVVAEAIGIFGGESKYDKLAKEFTRLLLVAYSATAIWGPSSPSSSSRSSRTSGSTLRRSSRSPCGST